MELLYLKMVLAVVSSLTVMTVTILCVIVFHGIKIGLLFKKEHKKKNTKKKKTKKKKPSK